MTPAEVLGLIEAEASQPVTLESRLVADLGLDSWNVISLTCRIEEALGVDITDETAKGWVTVQDVCNWVSVNQAKEAV